MMVDNYFYNETQWQFTSTMFLLVCLSIAGQILRVTTKGKKHLNRCTG